MHPRLHCPRHLFALLGATLLVAATSVPSFAQQAPAQQAPAQQAPAQQAPAQTVNISIDSPAQGSIVANGTDLDIGGWAADTAGSGPGIDMVEVYLDGPMDNGGVLLGSATYGAARPDVGAVLGNAAYASSGYDYTWAVDGIPAGNHTLYVYAHALATGWWSQAVSVTVQGQPTTAQTTDTSQSSVTYSDTPSYQSATGAGMGSMGYPNGGAGQSAYQNGAGYPYSGANVQGGMYNQAQTPMQNPYAGAAYQQGYPGAGYQQGYAGAGYPQGYTGAGYPQGYGATGMPYGGSTNGNGNYDVTALASMFGNPNGQYPGGYPAQYGSPYGDPSVYGYANQGMYGSPGTQYAGMPYGYGNSYQNTNPYGYQSNAGYPYGYPSNNGYPYGYPQ